MTVDLHSKSFTPAKPIKGATLQSLASMAHRLVFQRKRDGFRCICVVDEHRIKIYSRTMDDLSGHFPDVIAKLEEARSAGGIRPNTVFDMEYVVETATGADDFSAVASIIRSLPAKALMRRLKTPGHFVVFDLLFMDGIETYKLPYQDRYMALQQVRPEPFQIAPLIDLPMEEAYALALEQGWEGLVAWVKDQGTIVRWNGRPARANCYKLKPELEDDFVAVGYNLGEGACEGVVGALILRERGTDGGVVDVGKVGAGLTMAQRAEALSWQYPCVVQVRYSARTPDNALQFPVFMRKRDDKRIDE